MIKKTLEIYLLFCVIITMNNKYALIIVDLTIAWLCSLSRSCCTNLLYRITNVTSDTEFLLLITIFKSPEKLQYKFCFCLFFVLN